MSFRAPEHAKSDLQIGEFLLRFEVFLGPKGFFSFFFGISPKFFFVISLEFLWIWLNVEVFFRDFFPKDKPNFMRRLFFESHEKLTHR